MINKFDIVKTQFDEIGIVRHVETKKLWGNMVKVEMIKVDGVFNQLGDIVEYRPESLTVVKELHF